MNKEQKEQEQRLRILKFDCEMRLKSVEIAATMNTSVDVKRLLLNAENIARYVFGVREKVEDASKDQPVEQKNKEKKTKDAVIENKEGIIK